MTFAKEIMKTHLILILSLLAVTSILAQESQSEEPTSEPSKASPAKEDWRILKVSELSDFELDLTASINFKDSEGRSYRWGKHPDSNLFIGSLVDILAEMRRADSIKVLMEDDRITYMVFQYKRLIATGQ